MSEQLFSPEVTYERLCGEARDPRRRRSLQAINEICRILHDRGSSDFSYRTIVALGGERGFDVPGEKSLVNSTGGHYRELIQSWKQVSVAEKPDKNMRSSKWIDAIADPPLRLAVSLLAKELSAIKAKLARQRGVTGAPIYLDGGDNRGALSSKQLILNEAEISALKAAIDPAILVPLGLSIGSRGEVIDTKRRAIHKPGFRDAIEKILSVHSF